MHAHREFTYKTLNKQQDLSLKSSGFLALFDQENTRELPKEHEAP